MPTNKGEQARAEILEAAKRLFISQGYNATSMRDIAKEAGDRAVAGIYNHFATKEAIFEALIEEQNPYHEIIGAVEAGHGDTAPAYIRNVMHTIMPVISQYIDFMELVQIDLREFHGEKVGKVLAEIVPLALQLVTRLQTLPDLKPIEPIAVMRLVASVVISYGLTEKLFPAIIRDTLPQERWIDLYIETLLHGIAVEEDV